MPVADLPTFLANRTVGMPTGASVERISTRIVRKRPEDRLVVAIGAECVQGLAHERASHAASPRRWIDRDRVEFAEAGVDAIAAHADPGKPYGTASPLGNPPAVGRWSKKIAAPAFDHSFVELAFRLIKGKQK